MWLGRGLGSTFLRCKCQDALIALSDLAGDKEHVDKEHVSLHGDKEHVHSDKEHEHGDKEHKHGDKEHVANTVTRNTFLRKDARGVFSTDEMLVL